MTGVTPSRPSSSRASQWDVARRPVSGQAARVVGDVARLLGGEDHVRAG
ncbi:MAG TPA: hypothetical protein VHO07_30920 [Streptosporangiaceae bacterium]|nr:hypothetical protein [Streptosporangiaceae bacterium]